MQDGLNNNEYYFKVLSSSRKMLNRSDNVYDVFCFQIDSVISPDIFIQVKLSCH